MAALSRLHCPSTSRSLGDSQRLKGSATTNIGAGYEWRRGTNRLRVLYGGELFYQFNRGVSETYEYGNEMNGDNNAPTSTDWSFPGVVTGEFPTTIRTLESTGQRSHGIGLRAFLGIEYFFAPKICVGTEFGYGGMYSMVSKSSYSEQYWDPMAADGAGQALEREIDINGGGNRFSMDTDNFNGALYLMFYLMFSSFNTSLPN